MLLIVYGEALSIVYTEQGVLIVYDRQVDVGIGAG
jgi:hypothetical protein